MYGQRMPRAIGAAPAKYDDCLVWQALLSVFEPKIFLDNTLCRDLYNASNFYTNVSDFGQ